MSHDFVETNIVIGYTVDWDRQSSVVGHYVETRPAIATIHTSTRVLDEAEKVVNERRRVAKQAARRIFQNSDSSGGHPAVDDIVNFVWAELDAHREAVRDHVIQHIRDNEYYYTGLTQTNEALGLTRTLEDIDSDFDEPIAVINAIRAESHQNPELLVFDNVPRTYDTGWSIYTKVNQYLGDAPMDRDILLDSYRLTQEQDLEHLVFVTLDSDLLDNETELEGILDVVDIERPDAV